MPASGGEFGLPGKGRGAPRLGVGLLLGLMWGACAQTPPPPPAACEQPPPVSLQLAAGERLNPDDQGRSLPTSIQILQLKDARRLEAADFQDVWQRPKEVLAEDLLSVDALTLEPAQSVERQVTRDPKAEYLVVVGVFRRPAGQVWRAVARLPQVRPEDCGPERKGASRETALRFLAEDYRIVSRSAEVRR